VVIVGHEALTDLVTKMMQGAGSTRDEALAVAENLVEANLMGHDSHGVGLAPRYMLHAVTGTMTPGAKVSLVTDNGVYVLLDGNMGYGQTIGRESMEIAINKVKKNGAAIVGLRNVHHLGRIGAWGELCAKAGFISIHYVNATGHKPYVAPYGGYEARYSTNPYCTALPATEKTPMMVLDMATSRVAQGKVRVAHYAEKPMPMDDALVGPNGKPTTDPGVVFREPMGAMMSFGQHKGSGLAILCDLLAGGLPGGGTARPELNTGDTIRNNMLTIVIDPAQFNSGVPFADEFDSLVAYVKSGQPAEGHDEIMVAGEPEQKTMDKRKAEGISIDDNTWAEMIKLGCENGMTETEFDKVAG
jgi:hydroxycarboxylate dehydrogenase B